MQDPAFRRAGWPIGFGMVESANTLVVEARLKGTGMRLKRTTVHPMLALRNRVCNERWQETWQTASQQRLDLLAHRHQRTVQRQKAKQKGRSSKSSLRGHHQRFLLLHLFFLPVLPPWFLAPPGRPSIIPGNAVPLVLLNSLQKREPHPRAGIRLTYLPHYGNFRYVSKVPVEGSLCHSSAMTVPIPCAPCQ